MSALRARAEEYLAMRRALGFKLESQGPRLMSFVRFCEERSAGHVGHGPGGRVGDPDQPGQRQRGVPARRLDVVRIFARHLQALDPATEIPPGDVLSRRQWRIPPYLYSPAEITALMSAAGGLQPAIRAATWRTLVGLLAVTGMRQGEACRLGRDDAGLAAGTLTIRDSKFGKSRLVFLHPTTVTALRAYEKAREKALPEPEAGTFLLNSRGRALDRHNTPKTFATLVASGRHPGPARAARPEDARPAPRIHRRDPAGLVPRRRGRPGPAPGPIHLARPRQPQVNVLAPPGRPRAPRPDSRLEQADRDRRAAR